MPVVLCSDPCPQPKIATTTMSLFQRLLSFLQPIGQDASSNPDSLDSSLGIELTRLPPAPDLRYHIMREDGRRAGMLLVSESGRRLPFLATWVEDAGGLWPSEADRRRITSSEPLGPPPTGACVKFLLFNPPVVAVPLSSPMTRHSLYVVRRVDLGRRGLDKATLLLRHDWVQAVIVRSSPNDQPRSFTAFMGANEAGETSAVILPLWWHETLGNELSETVRGGEPGSTWEETNMLWAIRFAERLRQRVFAWKRDGTKLPDEAGGAQALAQLDRFLELGLARGAQFHWTTL